MADFNVVHQRALSEASRNLRDRRGDIWNVALEEPLRFDGPMSATVTVTVIQIKMCADRNLHPANPGSLAAMRAWKERFKDTPNEAFEFPKGASRPVGTPPAPEGGK